MFTVRLVVRNVFALWYLIHRVHNMNTYSFIYPEILLKYSNNVASLYIVRANAFSSLFSLTNFASSEEINQIKSFLFFSRQHYAHRMIECTVYFSNRLLFSFPPFNTLRTYMKNRVYLRYSSRSSYPRYQ